MILQISSGKGPAECELAVGLLFQSLKREVPDIQCLSSHASGQMGGYSSILFQTTADLSRLVGSVQWICKSPYRPYHKRKNWFIEVRRISGLGTVCQFREEDVKYEHFRSGGSGGQHVNKVETGVRLIHLPTKITVTSTSERCQYLNKKEAMKKLKAILHEIEQEGKRQQDQEAWSAHQSITRGNPIRIYEGIEFRLKKDTTEV